MTTRLRTRLSVEALDARDLPDATPLAAVAGPLAAPAYSSTGTHTLLQGRGTTHDVTLASDALADDVQFSAPLRVEAFAIRSLTDRPVDAVVGFHAVDPATGGPGAAVASFLIRDLPVGDKVQSVALPADARFTWEPTAGIYKNTSAYAGDGGTGGFVSVRFRLPDGTPLVDFPGGSVAANPSRGDPLVNQANGTGTLNGFWDFSRSDNFNSGGIDYQPHSLWLQVGGRAAGSATAPRLAAFTLAADQVRGGRALTGTVELAAPAPAGGVTIRLTSSNPSVAGVPETVFIPEGATRATFTVTTVRVSATTPVTITAALGGDLLSDQLTVTRR